MKTVVCVLKSGVFKPWTDKPYTIQYGPHHVRWLRDQFAAQVRAPHRFVCMSDIDVPGVEVVPLRHNLPGWWSKLEIFEAFQDACYVDLDTVLIGDVSTFLFNNEKFVMAASLSRKHGVNSSVMSWRGDYSFILHRFLARKQQAMAEYVKHSKWGDQDFIRDNIVASPKWGFRRFQELYPGSILSYKYDIRDANAPTKSYQLKRTKLRGAWMSQPRIVCFHGAPKPAEAQHEHSWIPRCDF